MMELPTLSLEEELEVELWALIQQLEEETGADIDVWLEEQIRGWEASLLRHPDGWAA
jgi:hypothetical protein